jgi:alkylation response protein AidB-like acyl-CoA dehydrogenase
MRYATLQVRRSIMKDIEKEREMIRAAAEKTVQKIIQPRAAEIDEKGELPQEVVDAFGKQGLLAMLLPEEYGGTDGNITTFCMVIEEIAKVSASSSMLILAQGMGTLPIWLAGDASQKERCFNEIAENNVLAAFALGEAGRGLEASSLKTSARKEGKDYFINGRKESIANGGVAKIYSVFALTGGRPGSGEVSAFIVEDGAAGLRFGKKEEKIGMRGPVTADVIFEGCRVPLENRLGAEGSGWKTAVETLRMSNPAMGAQAVGIAQGALANAIRYANERIQFKKPISSFQAVQFMISDMATQVEAARALVYQAASAIDTRLEDAEKLSAVSKFYASDAAMKVTTDAVQILGGYGYMKDYPVERMMRDAKVTQIFGESSGIQRLVVARQMLSETA